MERRGGGLSGVLLVVIAVIGFGVLLFVNARPTPELRVIIPTEALQTEVGGGWERVLEAGFGSGSTPLPTIAIPTASFAAPTLALVAGTDAAPLSPIELRDPIVQSLGASTPTLPPPTGALLATAAPLTAIAVTRAPQQWQPPPLIPPLSRDALGRDHYYFYRPVDSNATNRGLFYYPYGSDGPDNSYRVHSGLDMPNDIGQTVRAAGSGVVIWAGPGFQDTASYGNVVVIEHDFGHDGRRLYTLYAHLSAVLVLQGQPIAARDYIGLVGNTGRVSGPHVHFEVRMGDANSTDVPDYGDTYNPVLWMAPYVDTGVIAGRLEDERGRVLQDADITIRTYATGLNADTTTTYIQPGTTVDMNSDLEWDENFVVGDLPEGRYEVIAVIDGVRVSRLVTVLEGTTTFVELSPTLPTAAAP
ncbi:MAG: peptidoglycan DD-metalloendopeptidase family protein [Chloroflexota bacterium]|nr:peptidoglycan DD-metalloendopeptidase family protein [Chloroflexota bacterium]